MVEIADVGGSADGAASRGSRAEHGLSSSFVELMSNGRVQDRPVDVAVAGMMRRFGLSGLEISPGLLKPEDEMKPIKVSDDVAKFLKDELGVKEKYLATNTVHFELEKARRKTFPGAPTLWFEEKVSFDIKAKKNRIDITNMDGVMVRPDYSPWVYINRATFQRLADGTCTAAINAGRIGLSKTKTIKISKSVYDKLERTVNENTEAP